MKKEITPGSRFLGFHDGKWSLDRMVVFVVDEVVERDAFGSREWMLWSRAIRDDIKSAIEGCTVHYYSKLDKETTQFWDWNCTRFYIGHIDGRPETLKDPLLIAQRPEGFGWYAVNWNYEVDFEDEFRRTYLRKLRRWAKESGNKIVLDRESGLYRYEPEASK